MGHSGFTSSVGKHDVGGVLPVRHFVLHSFSEGGNLWRRGTNAIKKVWNICVECLSARCVDLQAVDVIPKSYDLNLVLHIAANNPVYKGKVSL
jgi:hypothetical protein